MGTDIFLLFDIPAFPSPIFLSQTWVSLSTCLSTTVPHKAGYSFAASTVLATWLWTRLTSAKVLVTLITDDINDKEAAFLQNALSDLGAHVSLREVETNTSCVLMAQVARLLAFNDQRVAGGDLVMMGDSDMLITSPSILDPLTHHDQWEVWVYWWEAVVHLNQSLPLSLLTMRADAWRRLMGGATTVREVTLLPGSTRRVFTRPGETSATWEVDQSTTTTALLKAGLCSPPSHSSLWQRLGLEPKTHSPDACWRGQGYGECRASLGSVNYPGLTMVARHLPRLLPRFNPAHVLPHLQDGPGVWAPPPRFFNFRQEKKSF